MTLNRTTSKLQSTKLRWQDVVAQYQNPDVRKSLSQIANTFIPYFCLWYLMYRSLAYSYGLTLALAVPTAGFLIRMFIILHDCGHGSFFKSQKANGLVGSVCGVLIFTPYYQWRHDHAVHHATAGDLERRGVGDVLTLTVNEYLQLSKWERFKYRLYRHPLVMFGFGPLYLFLLRYRFSTRTAGKRERASVLGTNLALLAIVLGMSLTIGFNAFWLIQLPVLLIAATAGVWLFYVQHQFEDTYWEHHGEWDYAAAALQGSSYYKLPKVLQWFTGNIGLHHIHHLSPQIPNYNLQRCHDNSPLFQQISPLTFWKSLRAISFRLWDEEQRRLVGFRHLKSIRPQGGA